MNGVVAADLFVARACELCMPDAGSCYNSNLEAERGETSASSSKAGLFFASYGVFPSITHDIILLLQKGSLVQY